MPESHGLGPPTVTPAALVPFFWLAAHAPRIVRGIQPLATCLVPLVSGTARAQTRRNALRIFGRALGRPEQRAFTRDVVNSFYEFVIDIGQSSRESVDQLLARIERVEGEGAYRSLRIQGRGTVLVTAHMGSFEVGLAALKRVEQRVHVVYKRDVTRTFESMRAKMRQTLGIIEAPIDGGLSTWMSLRDALLNGDVVVMQADRAMPGQKSAVVPFLHGHLRIPTGAVRLARLTGSPIVPVCTVRLASGRFAIHLHPAIEPGRSGDIPDSNDPTVLAVGKAIESMVATNPTQWLVLGAAFEEDVGHV
ncbi:MAG: lysophospholipid acyltransferase family protein [Phycisphaerales bacterium]|nr:lysophospholipid acyltransferase family protein [Phycisphaerales bacterium]